MRSVFFLDSKTGENRVVFYHSWPIVASKFDIHENTIKYRNFSDSLHANTCLTCTHMFLQIIFLSCIYIFIKLLL